MENLLTASLLLLESRVSDRCVICGRKASHKHHLVQKGMGGRGRKAKEGAVVSLCVPCHEAVHNHTLHFRGDGGRLGFLRTDQPMKYQDALDLEGWVYLD